MQVARGCPSPIRERTMIMRRSLRFLVLAALLTGPVLGQLRAAEPITVLTKEVVSEPQRMMTRWLNGQQQQAFDRWDKTYEELKTLEQIAEYQQRLRDRFVEELGGFPERTPLNPQITGTISKEGYRIEKVLFESQPGHYVSGLCFVPDSPQFKAPYPAVVVVCGHSANGKAQLGYQSGTALLALNGMIGLIIDPICQGERYQHLDDSGKITLASSTQAHTMVGMGAILLGQNTARFEIWDAMRAIDYLQSRDDVAAELIGCMGNSGGGTQTSYVMALEDRVKAASPSCYITGFKELLNTIGPQDAEQNIHGQLAWGMDHADYLLMRSPVPIHMCVATHDFFSITGAWDAYRKAKRLYTRVGYPERVSLAEVDEKHGWHQPLRESAVQWMSRWLAKRDISVREPKIDTISDEEAHASPRGQVQLIPGARSVFDLNIEEYENLAERRAKNWQNPEQALAKVREIAGIRNWNEIPTPAARKTGTLDRGAVKAETWVLEPEPGILLPAVLYRPAENKSDRNGQSRFILCVNEHGKSAEFEWAGETHTPESLAQAGATVLAVDLRGMGETSPDDGKWYHARFGEDARQVVIAYLLGRSYVGLRAEDLLATLKWAQTDAAFGPDAAVELISVGECGPPVLHAACLAPQKLIKKVQLRDMLKDWYTIVASPLSEDQVVNTVHGALRDYDLTDLIKHLGGRASIENPLDAMKQPIR